MQNKAKQLVGMVVVASLSGCQGCSSRGITALVGELVGVEANADGRTTNEVSELTISFSRLTPGLIAEQFITLRNVGSGPLELSEVEPVSGETVHLLSGMQTLGSTDAPFHIDYRAGTTLANRDEQQVMVRFVPNGLKERHESQVRLKATNASPDRSAVLLTIRGESVSSNCTFPSVIDLGTVGVGESASEEHTLVNVLGSAADAEVSALGGTDASAFRVEGGGPGAVSLMPGGRVALTFSFKPTEARDYQSTLTVRGAGPCMPVEVTVKGRGIDSVLEWTPSALRFGRVSPGATATRQVTFTNRGSRAVTLRNAAFSVTGYSALPTGDVVIPTGRPTTLDIGCSPTALGPMNGTYAFDTGLMRTPRGTITLECSGGGPRIRVTPRPTLAFGRVALTPGQPNTSSWRKITIQNVGVSGMANPDSNLFLGRTDPMTMRVGLAPLVELAGPNAAEFELTLSSNYNTATGLPAVSGQNATELTVRLRSNTLGPKQAEVIVHSNDGAEPLVRVALTALVEAAPPCRYTITPAQVAFGLVTPGAAREMRVTLTNDGTGPNDYCYFSNFRFAPGSDPAFSIASALQSEIEVAPTAQTQILLRAAPMGTTPTTTRPLAGTLLFDATSGTQPLGQVALTAALGPACLSIAPDPLDFGTVRSAPPPSARCNSPARSISLYNTCSQSIVVRNINLSSGAGLPAGSPGCAGSASCPEFSLVSTPTIPTAGLVIPAGGAPVTFQARYSPLDIGADTGVVSITVDQNGASVTYIASLRGRGDAQGQAADTYIQDSIAQADILLVIDNSCSMAEEQSSLASNFANFLQYATAASVDYQIGVVTTDRSQGGRLVATGLPTPYLTPTTPNASTVFGRMVNVGTGGSTVEMGFEPATMALSAANLSGPNAGFLRQQASLAVVVVSDADDQSPQPIAYYENLLFNVKGFNNRAAFTFSDIGPYLPAGTLPAGCSYDGPSATRYPQVVRSSGGVQAEICTPNWAQTLQSLGRTAFGFRTQFFLNNMPDLMGGQPVVTVNGMVVNPGPSTYTYDVMSNSIRFSPAAAPAAGQTLTISYRTACN
jgi:hypothetical protein